MSLGAEACDRKLARPRRLRTEASRRTALQRIWRSAHWSATARAAHRIAPIVALLLLTGASAAVAERGGNLLTLNEPTAADISGLVILLLLMFSVLTASLHLVGRRRWTQREAELASELARTRAALDRANLFLASEPQILVAWDQPGGEPRIEGDFSLVADAPSPRRILAFGSWLAPDLAETMDQRDRASAPARRSLLARRRQPQGPPFRDRRPRGRRLRGHAHSRHFRRAPAACSPARKPRRRQQRAGGAARAARRDAATLPGRATAPGASTGPISPTRARSKPPTPPTRWRAGSSCSTPISAPRRPRRAASRAHGGGARPPSSPAVASCSRRSRSRPKPAPPALPPTFPNSSRCAPRWNGHSAPIRACSTNCRPRWRSSTAPRS